MQELVMVEVIQMMLELDWIQFIFDKYNSYSLPLLNLIFLKFI